MDEEERRARETIALLAKKYQVTQAHTGVVQSRTVLYAHVLYCILSSGKQ